MRHFASIAAGVAGMAVLAAGLPAHAEKVLKVGMAAADLGSLDPHRTATTPDKAIIGWMFNGLVRFKPGTMNPEAIQPDIAQSWRNGDAAAVDALAALELRRLGLTASGRRR